MHVPRDRRLEDWIRELARDKKLYLFYKSPEWLALRAEVMRDHHNECERCTERGKLTRAETVHHENEVRKRPDMALTRWVDEPDGTRREVLHPLCNQCHNEVHGRVLSGNPPKPQLNAEKW